jgi:hypothetical protein
MIDGSIVHFFCHADRTRLRAMELRDETSQTIARAEQAVARAKQLVAPEDPATPTGGFMLFARISQIDRARRVLVMGETTVRLAEGIALATLRVGDWVTVSGVGSEGERLGLRVIGARRP